MRRCEYAADYDTATPHVLDFGKMPDAERQVLPPKIVLNEAPAANCCCRISKNLICLERLPSCDMMYLRWCFSASSAKMVHYRQGKYAMMLYSQSARIPSDCSLPVLKGHIADGGSARGGSKQ